MLAQTSAMYYSVFQLATIYSCDALQALEPVKSGITFSDKDVSSWLSLWVQMIKMRPLNDEYRIFRFGCIRFKKLSLWHY